MYIPRVLFKQVLINLSFSCILFVFAFDTLSKLVYLICSLAEVFCLSYTKVDTQNTSTGEETSYDKLGKDVSNTLDTFFPDLS